MIRLINRNLEAGGETRTQKQRGFTLVELLVTIVIIGILTAIAIPVFLNQRQSAWKASLATDLKNAAVVVETWGMDHSGSFAAFPVSNAANGIKVTDGNSIVVSPSATTFTILGSNTNISPGNQIYDRAAGGLGKFTPQPDANGVVSRQHPLSNTAQFLRRIADIPPFWGGDVDVLPLFVGFRGANGAANMISGGIAFGGHLSINILNEQESIT